MFSNNRNLKFSFAVMLLAGLALASFLGVPAEALAEIIEKKIEYKSGSGTLIRSDRVIFVQ